MADGVDAAAETFAREIQPAAPARPRDDAGRFAETPSKPETMFQVRMVEGDPETGDTSDGGDDPRLRAIEREVGNEDDTRDDRKNEPSARRPAAKAKGPDSEHNRTGDAEPDDAAADEGHEGAEDGQGEGDEEPVDDEEQYEVTVDGEHQTVSFNELRNGYIREATFHSRLNKVNEHRQVVDQENARVTQLRDLYITGLQHLDEDLVGMMPKEPDWDEEFEKDPAVAHRKQKEFQLFHGKLNQIRANRAWAIQNAKEEYDRASARYAVEQFSEFVAEHPKLFKPKDDAALQKIVSGMRQVALNEGFEEHVIAGVYDKKMLNVLLKAYLYDRGETVRPQAVSLPGPGKTLVPGSAKPIGNAGRRNIDEASRRLATTGRIEDAANYFHKLLR